MASSDSRVVEFLPNLWARISSLAFEAAKQRARASSPTQARARLKISGARTPLVIIMSLIEAIWTDLIQSGAELPD